MSPDRLNRRSIAGTYVIVAAVAIVSLVIFAWVVREQARESARKTAATTARTALATQRSQQLAACARGNLLRAASQRNTDSTRALELFLAQSRTRAAAHEVTDALRRNDLRSARHYRMLAGQLTDTPLVDCAAIYAPPNQ